MSEVPLAHRFPAAHQFLRACLIDEVFPIAPWAGCWCSPAGYDAWDVALRWPEIGFDASERFSGADLRAVFGRWSAWVRARAFEIGDRLPV